MKTRELEYGGSRHGFFPGHSNGRVIRALLALACYGIGAHAQSIPGAALSFDGDGQRVHNVNFFTNVPTTEVTVEFWQNASGLRAQSSFSQDDSSRGGWDPSNVFNAHVPYSDGRVYGDFGDISGEGRLYYTPPVILTHPQSLKVNVADAAQFMVVAESPLPMDYRWLSNGGPIPGETNATLTLREVQSQHFGAYAVVVSNLLGWVTSSNAHLTLNRFPVADASATRSAPISPNGVEATVILDASRSSDPDGDLLQYL